MNKLINKITNDILEEFLHDRYFGMTGKELEQLLIDTQLEVPVLREQMIMWYNEYEKEVKNE